MNVHCTMLKGEQIKAALTVGLLQQDEYCGKRVNKLDLQCGDKNDLVNVDNHI